MKGQVDDEPSAGPVSASIPGSIQCPRSGRFKLDRSKPGVSKPDRSKPDRSKPGHPSPDPRPGSAVLPTLFLLAAAAVCLVLLWASASYHLHRMRDGEMDQARHDATNLSVALAEQVSRLVAGADQIMRLMQADFRRDPTRFDFPAWLSRATSLHVVVNQIALMDHDGNVVAARTPPPAGTGPINVADRAYFAYLSTHGEADLYVGRTVTGRYVNERQFQLARRLERPDGTFAGVLLVSLDPSYLERQFRALDTGRDGSVTLFGFDGYARVRIPSAPGMYDRDASKRGMSHGNAGVFEHLAAASEGTYERTSGFDHVPRLYGYRLLDGLPLAIVVGRSLSEILAPVGEERRRTTAAASAATVLVLALAAALAWEFARRTARERQLIAAERALREAEAGVRGVFESSTDMLCVHRVSPDGAITLDMLNGAAAAATGIDPASARGKDLADSLPPHVAAAARAHIERVVASGEPVRTQDNRALGEGRSYESVLIPLFEDKASGRVTRVVVSVRDITHLREADVAIARSEARFRSLAETTSDVITRLALDRTREYVSPACRALLGYEPEEMLGRVPSDAMHPEDGPRVRDLAQRLIAGEIPDARVTATYRTRHKLGHWVWVEASMSLGRDALTGEPDSMICTLRDVTERRATEAAVAASEARFRLLAENASEMIVLGDDFGRRSYVSPASLRLVGFTPEAFAAMPLTERVHSDDVDALERTLKRTREGEVETAVICRFRHRDGEWRWLESVFRRVPGAKAGDRKPGDRPRLGNAVAQSDRQPTVVVTVRDVTERQAQSRALEEAKRAAEQASSAKSEFLATMSHEIRTPLNGILGYTDLLLADDRFTGDRRRHVERIRGAGAALRTVVDDILDFSKIEAGRVDLDPRPFALATLVADAVSIVSGGINGRTLDISTDLDARVPAVLVGDEDRLRQILLNLLNNAVKFTPAGGVYLSVAPARGPLGWMRFTVTDTGIGIPPDKRDRLFERFSQVNGTIRRRYGGTGLGLAICRSLVEAMGGAIGVEGAEGQGSTFWFEVPLPAGASEAGADIEREDAGVGVRPARVLLVEDQALNQDLVRAVLEAAGHAVVVVGDGAQAVRAVREAVFDLVLMDAQMPVMDGISATRRIRAADHPSRDVPIVAMSANVMPAQVAALLAAGMDDHVGKPFRQRDLFAAVARWTPSEPGAYPPREASLDARALADLAGSIGAARLRALMRAAIDQVGDLIAPAAGCFETMDTSDRDRLDRDRLGNGAHALSAATGTLGLDKLSTLLRALERACGHGALGSIGGQESRPASVSDDAARGAIAACLRALRDEHARVASTVTDVLATMAAWGDAPWQAEIHVLGRDPRL